MLFENKNAVIYEARGDRWGCPRFSTGGTQVPPHRAHRKPLGVVAAVTVVGGCAEDQDGRYGVG
jgi:hypothetical protein